MVDSVSSNTKAPSLADAFGGKEKSLGRDAFLKLLVAQLRHQDPLKPQDDSAFIAELAQFSSLEQTMGINDRLDLLSMQSQGLQNSQVASLVGKQAVVRGSLVTTDATGVGVPITFKLDGATDQTVVTIRNQNGEAVRTMDLGGRAGGSARVMWDGRDGSGNIQPAGTYSISIQATSANGGAVSVSQETTGVIESVSFDKGYPVLQLDTGVKVPVADLLQVGSPPKPSNP